MCHFSLIAVSKNAESPIVVSQQVHSHQGKVHWLVPECCDCEVHPDGRCHLLAGVAKAAVFGSDQQSGVVQGAAALPPPQVGGSQLSNMTQKVGAPIHVL